MATGRIGGPQQKAAQEWRRAPQTYGGDAEALAAYNRTMMEAGAGRLSPDVTGRAELTASGYQMANDLRRRQSGLMTGLALTNRSNPFASLRQAHRGMLNVDYMGARDEAIARAIAVYEQMLQEKKSRDAALLAARQQMTDQYIGAGTQAAGALLAQYSTTTGGRGKPVKSSDLGGGFGGEGRGF